MMPCTVDRINLENEIMQCWRITDDLDVVANMIADTDMSPKDMDRLMNVVIGMKELYNVRFSEMFTTFEDMISHPYFEKPAPKRSQEFFPHD